MAAVYDLCIVGAGMVGSAAARHATLPTDSGTRRRVCLVGPEEPKTRDIYSTRDVFGAHYDEGRIIRELDPHVTWSTLSIRSIQRYRDIEKASGIGFYTESGFLAIGNEGGEYITNLQNVSKINQIKNAEYLSRDDVLAQFPYMDIGPGDVGYFAETKSGHISARKMVLAQQTAAARNGCDVINDVVQRITEDTVDGGKILKLLLESGKKILTKKVLLATNAYTNLCDLLPSCPKLDMQIAPTCVALAEISDDCAESLRSMPTVIYYGTNGSPNWDPEVMKLKHGDKLVFYLLPPIKYPDGKYYLKLGTSHRSQTKLETKKQLQGWYCGNPSEEIGRVADIMGKFITSVLPGVKPVSIKRDTCVLAETPSDLPYIDMASPNIAVAVGGNGRAAKSADEIGRLGVELITTGQWRDDLPAELFRIKYMSNS